MTGQCCTGEGPSRRLARRLSGAAGSLLPGAVLMVLPKCPLCFAAWLMVITGAGVSAAAAARVRDLIVVFWVAVVAVTVAKVIQGWASSRHPARHTDTLLDREVDGVALDTGVARG